MAMSIGKAVIAICLIMFAASKSFYSG